MNKDLEKRCPSSPAWPVQLSNALWSRLWRLLEEQDQPPLLYETEAEARALIMAILYRALTDSTWDALPAGAPTASRVRAAYQRWEEQGVLDRLSDLLRVQLMQP